MTDEQDRHLMRPTMVRLPWAYHKAVRACAQDEDRTIASVIKRAIRRDDVIALYMDDDYIDEEECEHDAQVQSILEVLHGG